MSEDWYIANLDRREYFLVDIPLTEWTRTLGVVSPLWELLAKPLPPRPIHEILKLPECRDPRGTYRKTQGDRVGILHLPEELLETILNKVEDVQDAICFSLVNELFATMGRKRVHTLMSVHAGAWIGDRIIRVRPDVLAASEKDFQPIAWPNGVFTAAEKDEIEKFVRKSTRRRENLHKASMGRFFRKNFKQVNPVHRAYVDFVVFGKRLRGLEIQVFEEWGWPRYYGVGQEDKDWALCNLTTWEYVRAEELKAVAKSLKLDEGVVTLAHALMSRSYCVESGNFLHPECAVRLACWAGDKFEITTASRMRACGSGEGWRDVSSNLSEEFLKRVACPEKE